MMELTNQPVPSREKEIPVMLDLVYQELDQLKDEITLLHNRLMPVLSNGIRLPTEKIQGSDATTEVGIRLSVMTSSIKELREVISIILNDLEV